MRAYWVVPIIASILILGTLGFSQNVMALHNSSHSTACNLVSTVGGGALGNSPGPLAPMTAVLGWDVGSGQCNGDFSSVSDPAFTGGALELALRAEERRVGQITPSGINDYTVLTGFDANAPPTIFRAFWNFQASIAYNGDINNLDSLTLTIRTDVGPNLPSSPVFDMLDDDVFKDGSFVAIRGLIDDRRNPGLATSGFSDLYQISQNPEFKWFTVTPDTDANPDGDFDYSVPGAWLFTLTAVEGESTSSVSICIHTPDETCVPELTEQQQKAIDKANKAIDKKDKAIDKANDKADKAIDKANDKANKAIDKANDKIDKANDKKDKSIDKANDKKDKAIDKANDKACAKIVKIIQKLEDKDETVPAELLELQLQACGP